MILILVLGEYVGITKTQRKSWCHVSEGLVFRLLHHQLRNILFSIHIYIFWK